MADYCKQCSLVIWGKDHRELAGITTPEGFADGLAAVVICEGCGYIQVDPDGACISPDCYEAPHDHNRCEDPCEACEDAARAIHSAILETEAGQ